MDAEIELRHLRGFVAVAEHLHFSRAAAALHLAQPALSQQVRRLEELVGHPLLLRTSRSVALTPAGTVFLQRARRTLAALHQNLEEVRGIGRGEEGDLRVGFIGSAMLAGLPAVLQQYRGLYPRVSLRLSESFTSQVLAGLQNDSMDAGLLRDSDATLGIHREVLWTEPFVAVLPGTHPLAGRRALNATLLQNEPFVFYARSAGSLAYDKPLSLCSDSGFQPRVVQEASHWLSILRLVAVGLGVSIAPACVRSIAVPGVVCLPLAGTTARSLVELAYRDGEQRATVENFARVSRAVARQSTARHGQARAGGFSFSSAMTR